MFFPQCKRPSFTPIQTNRHNILTFIFLDTELEVAACAPTDSEHYLTCLLLSASWMEFWFYIVLATILRPTTIYTVRINYRRFLQKPYFHKYWTEIHYVTTIWKRNVCDFIVTLNAFDVRPHVWHGRCPGDTTIPAKPSQACLVWRSRSWKYGFAKSSDNLYALCRDVTRQAVYV